MFCFQRRPHELLEGINNDSNLENELWFHGSIPRSTAESYLVRTALPAGYQTDGTTNLFLVREKVAGLAYAISILSGDGVTHHLVNRAVRGTGEPGQHFIINDCTRLPKCTSIAHVLAELSRPDGERLPELAGMRGLPINRYCKRQATTVTTSDSHYAHPAPVAPTEAPPAYSDYDDLHVAPPPYNAASSAVPAVRRASSATSTRRLSAASPSDGPSVASVADPQTWRRLEHGRANSFTVC